MSIYKLIEYVRENSEYDSDYAIAKKLGFDTAKISGWKRRGGNADGPTTLKIMKLANLSTEKELEIMEGKEVETALFKRRICALNIKVNEYINPRKINYLKKIENLRINGQNIHYTQLVKWICKVLNDISKKIKPLFFVYA